MRETLADYCVRMERQDLLTQWDADGNGDLTPESVSYGSRRKVWWRCEKGHRWEAAVYTRTGRPLDRSNIWKELQALCRKAGVEGKRVFPHNFRHLFARAFYALEKDIAKLADLLGHASVETTRIYIMESGAEHTRQVERLGLIL